MNPKYVIIALLVAMVVALIFAGVFMVKDHGNQRRMAIALSVRIGLSITLILFLIVGFRMGWIHPHGIGIGGR